MLPIPGRRGRAERAEHLLRAIESQRAIASAAWEAYEREGELERALLRGDLDRVRRRKLRARGPARQPTDAAAIRQLSLGLAAAAGDCRDGEASGSGGVPHAAPTEGTLTEEYERPRHTSQGARYLAIALAAQREVSRLQGLYERVAQEPRPVHILVTRRPDGPENIPPETLP